MDNNKKIDKEETTNKKWILFFAGLFFLFHAIYFISLEGYIL